DFVTSARIDEAVPPSLTMASTVSPGPVFHRIGAQHFRAFAREQDRRRLAVADDLAAGACARNDCHLARQPGCHAPNTTGLPIFSLKRSATVRYCDLDQYHELPARPVDNEKGATSDPADPHPACPL